MLKLRVQIPDIGKEYDVQCNEKAYVEDMLQDILDLICRWKKKKNWQFIVYKRGAF